MIKKWWYRIHEKRIEKKKLKFVKWFHSLQPHKYCWTDCVAFAYSPTRLNPFKIDNSIGCKIESESNCENCYCGSWYKGECWDKMSKEKQNKIKQDLDAPVVLIEGLPF